MTTGFGELDVNPPGPDQLKVAPAVRDEPFKLTEVVVQVSVVSFPADEDGGIKFAVIITVSASEQPFEETVRI